MYVETGVLGFVVYVALLVAALVMAVRGMRALPDRTLGRGVAVGAVACTVAFIVGSVGGNLISSVSMLLYLFAFLALASTLPTARPVPARPPASVSGLPR